MTEFRENRLKVKSLEAFKAYVKSDECAKEKLARKLQTKLLRRRGL